MYSQVGENVLSDKGKLDCNMTAVISSLNFRKINLTFENIFNSKELKKIDEQRQNIDLDKHGDNFINLVFLH